MRTNFCLAFLFALFCTALPAQRFQQIITADTLDVWGESIQPVPGGFIVVGSGQKNGTCYAYAGRYDSTGANIWQHVYGTGILYEVLPLANGELMFAGCYMPAYGKSECLLMKADANGLPLWRRCYSDSAQFAGFRDIEATSDGGYLLTGSAICAPSTYPNALVVKTDVNGDTLWTRTFCDTPTSAFLGFEISGGDGYDICVMRPGFYPSLYRLDVNGHMVWQKTYLGSATEFLFPVFAYHSVDGSILFSGEISGPFGNYNVGMLLKMDEDGNVAWVNGYYCTSYNDQVYRVTDQPGGGYAMWAWTNDPSDDSTSNALFAVDSSGEVLWYQHYRMDNMAFPFAVAAAPDGYYLGSAVSSNTQIHFRSRLMHVGTFGQSPCLESEYSITMTPASTAVDTVNYISERNTLTGGSVYNAVYTAPFRDSVLCSSAVGLHDAAHETNVSVYPQPSTGEVWFSTATLHGNNFRLDVYDAYGQLVCSQQRDNNGSAQSLSLEGLPAGMYFLELTCGNEHARARIMHNPSLR